MNVSGQTPAHSLEMKLALFLAASLPVPGTRCLLLNLSHTAIICNSDDYEKRSASFRGTLCTLLLIKNKSNEVIGIH